LAQENISPVSVCLRVLPGAIKAEGFLPLDVYNKIDAISLEQVDKIARQPHSLVISCEMDLKLAFLKHHIFGTIDIVYVSLDYLIDRIWEDLRLVKIYTKKRGAHPDLADPICLRKGATIEVFLFSWVSRHLDDVCEIGRLQWHSSFSRRQLQIWASLGQVEQVQSTCSEG